MENTIKRGDSVYTERRRLNVRQRQLADRRGISAATLVDIENNRLLIDLTELELLINLIREIKEENKRSGKK